MANFPKTERGLNSRIKSYRAALQHEKRTYGSYDDSSGRRYLLFYLHFLLGDATAGITYQHWFDKNFDDDSGEPIALLCSALILHRGGKAAKAKHQLARLMLGNLYLIPVLLGEQPSQHSFRHASNWAHLDLALDIPEEILAKITDEDRQWLKELYESFEFRRYRKRFIEIQQELDHTTGIEHRRPLVAEARALLDEMKV